MNRDKDWHAGYTAGANGYSPDANPHKFSDPFRARQWRDGWRAAYGYPTTGSVLATGAA